MTNEVVTFGKYKDQPVEVMIADKSYTDYMLQQSWFKQRYTELHNAIISVGQVASETPEHNKIQIKFLDDGFCERFLIQCSSRKAGLIDDLKKHEWKFSCKKKFEDGSPPVDVKISAEWIRDKTEQEKAEEVSTYVEDHRSHCFTAIDAAMKARERRNEDAPLDWANWANEYWRFRAYNPKIDSILGISTSSICVEIKPSVGDDFPAVLRQIKRGRSLMQPGTISVLLLERYHGEGATVEQFVEFFKSEGIRVVFLADV